MDPNEAQLQGTAAHPPSSPSVRGTVLRLLIVLLDDNLL